MTESCISRQADMEQLLADRERGCISRALRIGAYFFDVTVDVDAILLEQSDPAGDDDTPRMLLPAAPYNISKLIRRPASPLRHLFDVEYAGGLSSDIRRLQIPTAGGLNRFKQQMLEPYGAHDLPFAYVRGGKFRARDIVACLALGQLPIATDPYWLLHDTAGHAVKAAAQPEMSMRLMRDIAGRVHAAERTGEEGSEQLCIRIAQTWDSHTDINARICDSTGLGADMLKHFLNGDRRALRIAADCLQAQGLRQTGMVPYEVLSDTVGPLEGQQRRPLMDILALD